MATNSTVCLFLDTLNIKPIIIDCPGRFASFKPKDYGGSQVFAIISSTDGDIHSPLHDGVTIGDEFHFILDSTFSSTFLLKMNNASSSEGDQSNPSNMKDNIVCLSDNSKEDSKKHVSLSSDDGDVSITLDTHVDSDVEGESCTPIENLHFTEGTML